MTAGPGSAAAGAARGAEPTGSAVRLSLGFAAANMGSFDWDLVTDRLEWDDRLHALFGYTAESFAPHIDSFRARVHPEDRARVDAALDDAVASGGVYAADYRIVRPDGEVRWVSARGRVLRDAEGRPARMLGAAHDVTDARSATDERAHGREAPAGSGLRVVHVDHADPGRREALAAALEAGLGAAPRDAGSAAPLVLPLVSRGRRLGAVAIGEPGEDPLDRRLLGDLVLRAGSAVDNAVLYDGERRLALTLQRSLLPVELPQFDGMQTAARYLPGAGGREVGGDFYVGHGLADGRVLLIIGDVMGHGARAAARMGQLRAVLTAFAFEGDAPERVLGRLAASTRELLDLPMATTLVAVYDPRVRRLTAASAGHLPPLLAPPQRPPSYVGVRPGPPLGVGGGVYVPCTIDVPPSSTVVLYTDGLIEDRTKPIDAGLERLRAALEQIRLPPEAVCDHVLRELGRADGAEDDIALLVFSHLDG